MYITILVTYVFPLLFNFVISVVFHYFLTIVFISYKLQKLQTVSMLIASVSYLVLDHLIYFQNLLPLTKMLLGQFYLVQFQTEEDNNFKQYIGQQIDFQESENIYSFSFLRFKAGKFSFPQVEDFAKVKKEVIFRRFCGSRLGTTSRQQRSFSFYVDFSKYNIY